MTDQIATTGDNRPDELAALRDALGRDNGPLMRRRDELLAAVARMPATVDDDNDGKFSDMENLLKACAKNAEAERVAAKEPSLAAGRVIDGFFALVIEPLKATAKAINAKLTVFDRAKADAERLRREAEARAAAEAARKAAEEAAAQAAAMVNQDDLDRAIAAAAAAVQAEKDRVAAEKAAAAKAADLSRARGEMSVRSLRTDWVHDPASIDRAALDLETLRAHLPLDCLEKGIRAFIRGGGRVLRGVTIFEQTVTVTR